MCNAFLDLSSNLFSLAFFQNCDYLFYLTCKASVPESFSHESCSLEAPSFIKTEILTHVFSVTFAKFLRAPIWQKICKRLLLKKQQMNDRFNITSGVTENVFNYLPEK